MKKTLGFLAILFFSFSLSGSGAALKKEKDKYDHWVNEEVSLLISKEEKEEFTNLKTDEEKDKFIELFWVKRDPSPGTKENEFKDEWYQRLDHVQNTFTRGSKKGWRSDQGRVYMFLGPPGQVSATAPRIRENPMGGSQQEPASEIWTYQPMPDLGLTSAFRVTFREYQYGYDLDQQTSQTILRALEIFPKVVLFNPEAEEIPRYRFSLDEGSFEGKQISDLMAAGQEVKEIPLEWKPIFTRASRGDTYVSLLVQVDADQLDKKKFREMTFFGRVIGEGEAQEDFLETVKTEKGEKDKLLAWCGFPVKPGQSTLYLGARGSDKDTFSLIISELDVPDYSDNQLNTGTLILSKDVVSASQPASMEEFDPFIIGQLKATPQWGNVFKPSDYLSVLFHIYNAQKENDVVSLKVEYFIISEEVGYKLNPQEIKEKIEPGKTLTGGTQVPLTPLKQGKYTFRIRITDNIAKKTIEREAEFFIE